MLVRENPYSGIFYVVGFPMKETLILNGLNDLHTLNEYVIVSKKAIQNCS